MQFVITRQPSSDQGTAGDGILTLDNGDEHLFATLELPWRDNQPDISCIPPGTYLATIFESPKFGRDVYQLYGVPRRTEILIHNGNWAGDKSLGYKTDVEGCILIGIRHGMLNPPEKAMGQLAVLESRTALDAFMAATSGSPLSITII